MICPRSRRAKFMSRTTVATTLIDEIDRATPRKSAIGSRCPVFGISDGGAAKPSAAPKAKGTAIPANETLSAGSLWEGPTRR